MSQEESDICGCHGYDC